MLRLFLIDLGQSLAGLLNSLLALLLQNVLLHLLPDALSTGFSLPSDQNAGGESKSEGVEKPPASRHLRPKGFPFFHSQKFGDQEIDRRPSCNGHEKLNALSNSQMPCQKCRP